MPDLLVHCGKTDEATSVKALADLHTGTYCCCIESHQQSALVKATLLHKTSKQFYLV